MSSILSCGEVVGAHKVRAKNRVLRSARACSSAGCDAALFRIAVSGVSAHARTLNAPFPALFGKTLEIP